MPIDSNASSDECSSPHYHKNKELCENWEQFVLQKDGKINAVFNAWSFDIKAKLKTERTWLIDVKKATYSNGSLLFSSKAQNLQEILTFQAKFEHEKCSDFKIGPKRWRSKIVPHPFCKQIHQLLAEEKQGKDWVSAQFKDGLLTLRFNHRNDDFELAERILKM